MRIAIIGGDGSGKTSVCNMLSNKIEDSKVVYGGKRQFKFKLTSFFLSIWSITRKVPYFPAFIPQFFLYYPMEFFENIIKFSNNSSGFFIYDRHPIDRLVIKNELIMVGPYKSLKRDLNILGMMLVSWFYKNNIKKIDAVFFLNPSYETCYVRSNGQYKSIASVKLRQEAYLLSLTEWKSIATKIIVIDISDSMSVNEVSNIIVDRLKHV